MYLPEMWSEKRSPIIYSHHFHRDYSDVIFSKERLRVLYRILISAGHGVDKCLGIELEFQEEAF